MDNPPHAAPVSPSGTRAEKGRRLLAALAPYALELLVLLSALSILLGHFPGEWDGDTGTQYTEMTSGIFRDWHPPAMGLLWGLLNRLASAALGREVEGSATIFVLHWALFYAGLWAVARKAREFCARLYARSPLALGLLLIAAALYFWSPRTVTCTRYVLKDTGMVAAFLAAFGLLLWAPAGRLLGRFMALAALPLLLYGAALRHNALPAALPFLWLAASRLRPEASRLRRSGAVLAMFLGLVVGGHVITYWIAGAEHDYPAQLVLTADILAIDKRTGEFVLPPSWEGRTTMSEEHFRNFFEYEPDIVNLLEHRLAGVPLVNTAEGFRELRSFWLDRVTTHPRVWLKVRMEFFSKLMRRFDIAGLRYDYLAVLCLAAALWQALVRRKNLSDDDLAFLFLNLSGLLYVAPYMLLTTGYASRLLYWFALACPLALARFLGAQRVAWVSAESGGGETRVVLHLGRQDRRMDAASPSETPDAPDTSEART